MRQLQTREEAPQITRAPAPPARSMERPGGGFTGKDFLRVLRKRKWLIGLILLVVTGLFVGGTTVWRQLLPGYEAKAYVLVRMNSPRPDEPDVISFANINSQTQEHLLNTRAQEIMSPTVMQEAARSEEIQKTSWYKKHRGRATEELLDRIKVTPSPKSMFIVVSMSGYGDYYKEDLPTIVNQVARTATDFSLERASGTAEDIKGNLDEDLGDLRNELSKLQDRLRLVQSDGSKENLTDQSDLLKSYIKIRNDKISDAQAEYAGLTRALESFKQMMQQGQLRNSPAVTARVDANPVINRLRVQADQLKRDYLSLKKSLGSSQRQVVATQVRWEAALDQLHKKQSELEDREAQALINEYELQVADRDGYIRKLQREIDDYETELATFGKQLDQIVQLQQEIENKQDQINRLETKKMEFQLTAGDGRVLKPMVLSERAQEPTEISSPKYVIMVPLGVFLGLALGVGLAFLLEFTDSSVKSPSDLARRVDLPLLGMVPHLDDIDDEIRDVRLSCLTNPNSLISESFRQIRTNVLFSGPAESRKTILVTSPSPEDGRSTVAANLASTMTAGGRKVLLVDANFRQPAVSKLFSNCPEGGLSSALVGEGKWEDLTAEVEPGLWVMGAGPLPPNPAELLDSEQMQQLMREMAGQFDQVILDGPPAMVVSDAGILAGQSDGVILVVRAGDNTYGLVQRCRDNLDRVGSHTLGAVLNGVRVAAGGYLRENYATFYDYHTQGRLPSKSS